MKKMLLLLVIALSVISCKNENDKETTTDAENNEASKEVVIDPVHPLDHLKQYSGEFIYVDNAAVLKGPNYIFGVNLNGKAEELRKLVEPVKTDPYDMVPVIVKGDIVNKPEGTEGWDKIITITEILDVGDTPSKADIKIEDKKS